MSRRRRGVTMFRLAKVMQVVAVGLLCVGCGTPPSDLVGPDPTGSTARSMEDVLACELVDFPAGDWAGEPAETARGAVNALVNDLGLDQADVQPWQGDIAATDDGGRWLLFKSDGSGYGVAIAGTMGGGGWAASVDQTCTDASAPTVLVSGPGDGSGMAAEVRGVLSVLSDQCVGIDEHLAIWPQGSEWDAESAGLRLPNGTIAKVGDTIVAAGGYVASADARRWAVGGNAQLCRWSAEVVVFNPGDKNLAVERK